MATTIQRRAAATGSGSPVPEFDLEAPQARRGRFPEIALGMLLVAVFGLAALWWFTNATDKVEVVALAGAMERGDVLGMDDLVVVRVATDDVLATVTESEVDLLVGRVALTDLAAGTLVTGLQFAADDAVAPGEGVVGLELDAGEIPTLRLLAGNTVSVILTPATGAVVELGDGGALEVAEVLVEAAVVVEASPVGQQGRQYVALSMTETEARAVAVAASQDRVRLVQVAGER